MADPSQSLADKMEISDVVHTYALNIRNRQPLANESLFSVDASFAVREADPLNSLPPQTLKHAQGRAEVMALIVASTATHRVFPAIHNLIVTLDGDCAAATSLMISTVFPGRRETLGEYQDQFRREHGKWRFAARVYTIFRES